MVEQVLLSDLIVYVMSIEKSENKLIASEF